MNIASEMVSRIGTGQFHSICTDDWSMTSSSLSSEIFAVFAEPLQFPLSREAKEATIAVEVNSSPAGDVWHHDGLSSSVIFDPGIGPAPGSNVEICYDVECSP